jgi:hypothetical protein
MKTSNQVKLLVFRSATGKFTLGCCRIFLKQFAILSGCGFGAFQGEVRLRASMPRTQRVGHMRNRWQAPFQQHNDMISFKQIHISFQ